MTSGPVIGMELVGENSVKKWRNLIGPTNTQVTATNYKVAREQAPNSIRAQFGTDGTKNACHGSDSSRLIVIKMKVPIENCHFFSKTDSNRRPLSKTARAE
jgi:nucleoside diphosphate kinase